MKKSISPEWTEKELAVIGELATRQDIPDDAVLRQALRMYQLVVEGHCRLVDVENEPKGAMK